MSVTQVRFWGNATRQYPELFQNNLNRGTQDYVTLSSRQTADTFLHKTLAQYVSDGPILEIGCNRGNNLIPLSKKYKVYGLELQADLLKELAHKAAKQNLEHNIQTAVWDFAEDGTLPPEWDHLKGKLKGIYAVHVISHLGTENMQKAFIRLCNTYLAPGGIVILTNTEPLNLEKRSKNYNRGTASHTAEEIKNAFPGFHLRAYEPYKNEDQHFNTLISDSRKLNSVLSRTYWWVFQKPDPEASPGGLAHFKNVVKKWLRQNQ
jgi:cyclopropane fatty-acyl-phospholipid synthase-like methyltransferase